MILSITVSGTIPVGSFVLIQANFLPVRRNELYEQEHVHFSKAWIMHIIPWYENTLNYQKI